MRKNSIKNTRINNEVQRELSEIIRSEVKDPRIHPMTTVVSVEVTPDLKFCKAYISVLASSLRMKPTAQVRPLMVSLPASSLPRTLIYALQNLRSGVTSTETTVVIG